MVLLYSNLVRRRMGAGPGLVCEQSSWTTSPPAPPVASEGPGPVLPPVGVTPGEPPAPGVPEPPVPAGRDGESPESSTRPVQAGAIATRQESKPTAGPCSVQPRLEEPGLCSPR